MNKEIYMAAFGGILIGIPIGYFLKKIIDNKKEDLENIRSAAWGYEQHDDENNNDNLFVNNPDSTEVKEVLRYEDVPEDNEEDENYSKFAVNYEHPSEEDTNRPYVITEDQFNDEHFEFEKRTLVYLSGDDTLVSEDEEVLSAQDLLGTRVVSYIKMVGKDYSVGNDGTLVIYVRNLSIGEDFEVIWSDMSYGRDYLGIFD